MRLGTWATGLTASKIPADVTEAARRSLLDTFAVMTAGRRHPATIKALSAFGGEAGPCRKVDGTTASAGTAALVNGVAAHAWDFDDTSYTGIQHGAAIILPAVFAAVEETGADDETALTAFVAGCETAYVLGEICTHAHYFRGWWSTLTLGVVGATAAVARVHGLDGIAGANAIALAAACAGGGKSVFGTDGKPFLVGVCARTAIDLAKGARAGITGPACAFEDSRGYMALLGGAGAYDEAATLGQRWRLVDPGLLLKRYPVCSAAQAAIEQTAELCAGLSPDEIVGIECQIPVLVDISLAYDAPSNNQEAQFSLPYAVACAAHHGSVDLADVGEEAVAAPAIRSIMAKVRKTVASDLSTDEMRTRYPESARIIVERRDGGRAEGFCGVARGMPTRPLTAADLAAKFEACVRFGFDGSPRATGPVRDCLLEFGHPKGRSLALAVRDLWTQIPATPTA
jgi:2-methylcitrate dehydratase PrpD